MWPAEHFKIIELNLTELCNMSCVFCPRAFDYPNQNLHMSLDIVDMIVDQLDELPHIEKIAIAGRGEPTLYKHFAEMAQKLIDYRDKHRPSMKLQLATNGRRVDTYEHLLRQFNTINLSVYDQSKLTVQQTYDKYHSWENVAFFDRRTVTLSDASPNTYHNRAGSAPHPVTRTEGVSHRKYGMTCEKPMLVAYISWNGDYNLCCNDWEDIQVLGNIHTETIKEFLTSNPNLKKYQYNLLAGKRDLDPCSTCNRPVHPRWINTFSTEVDKIRNK